MSPKSPKHQLLLKYILYKMANRNSPQSPLLHDQVPNQMKIGTEIPLDPDISDPELSPSPIAADHGSDNFLGLFSPRCWENSGGMGKRHDFYDWRPLELGRRARNYTKFPRLPPIFLMEIFGKSGFFDTRL